jgi:hypothetical protein
MVNHEGLDRALNLDLVWTQATANNTCRALVWIREPMQFAATICIDGDKQYAIHTQGLYGLSPWQREGLERHLESRGYSKRETYSGK